MNHVAPTLGLKPTKSSTTVGVGIGQKADGAFGLDLDITITVAGLTEDEARKLITRAHSRNLPLFQRYTWECRCTLTCECEPIF